MTAFLDEFNLNREALPTSELIKVFEAYEGVRIEHTSMMVKKAREQGELRVVSGVERCKERNEAYRQIMKNGGHAQGAAFALMYANSLDFKPIPGVSA